MFRRRYYYPTHRIARAIFIIIATAVILGGGYCAYQHYIVHPQTKEIAQTKSHPINVTHRNANQSNSRQQNQKKAKGLKSRLPSAKKAGKYMGIALIIIALFGLPFLMVN